MKHRLASYLRKIADKIDPPLDEKESSVILQPPCIHKLDGFEEVEPVTPESDWTWTLGNRGGPPGDDGYL